MTLEELTERRVEHLRRKEHAGYLFRSALHMRRRCEALWNQRLRSMGTDRGHRLGRLYDQCFAMFLRRIAAQHALVVELSRQLSER